MLRLLQLFRLLRAAVPPRVLAALWRTAWNGWVTGRRMRTLPGQLGRCIFGCPHAADAIEHYACCPVVRGWGAGALRLPPLVDLAGAVPEFLLLAPAPVRDPGGLLIRRALRTAAVYLTHGMVRHGRVQAGAAAGEALQQVCRDLVRGHRRAAAALDAAELERWGPPGGAAPPPAAAGAGAGG